MLLSLKELTALFKALSDATRLRVVNLLRLQSLSVGDLQVLLGLSQPTVSHQLAILRAAELVRAERQGTRVFYSLARRFLATLWTDFSAKLSLFSLSSWWMFRN